ncbi:LytTR family transcriptional regulator [Fibrella sp. USSR17]
MISFCHAPVTSLLPANKSVRAVVPTHLELPFRNRLLVLNFADIVWLEGAGNYTYIHTRDNKRYLSSKTLKRLEPDLMDSVFCRVHKSTIINLAYLAETNFSDTHPYLLLKGNQPIAISRRRLPLTRRQVKWYQRMTTARQNLA